MEIIRIMTSIEPIITVTNLCYEYPGYRALNDVSFSIDPHSITALVGPNGAGKTTLLRCLAALDHPFSGTISIAGINSQKEPRKLQRHLGYLSDFFGLYDDLTVHQSLTYMAWSHGLHKNTNEHVSTIAKKLDIDSLLNKKAKDLSRGQRQRLAIGQATIHQPKVLLLDEPASGLDPEARHLLSNLLLDFKNQGMTIIVSSHILAELEDYSSEMLVLKNGAIKEHVSLSTVTKEEEQCCQLEIRLTSYNEKYHKTLHAHTSVQDVTVTNNDIIVTFAGNESQQAEYLQHLVKKSLPVIRFAARKKSFENIYIEAVGK